MSLRAQPSVRVFGTAGLAGGMKAQCGFHSAPCSIQRTRIARSTSVSARCESGAGIITFGSVLRMRRTSSLRRGVAGDDGAPARRQLAEGDLAHVQAQAGLAHAVVGTVALEAPIREERLDVEVEVDDVGHAGDGDRHRLATRDRDQRDDRADQNDRDANSEGPHLPIIRRSVAQFT